MTMDFVFDCGKWREKSRDWNINENTTQTVVSDYGLREIA